MAEDCEWESRRSLLTLCYVHPKLQIKKSGQKLKEGAADPAQATKNVRFFGAISSRLSVGHARALRPYTPVLFSLHHAV